MDFQAYQAAALRTAKMFDTMPDNLDHAWLGLATEAGEFNTVVKRIAIYGKQLSDEFRANLKEELGDYCWYIALGLHHVGIAMEQAAQSRYHYGQSFGSDYVAALKYAGKKLLLSAADVAMNADATIMHGSNLHVQEALVRALQAALITADVCGFRIDDVLQENIDKLRARFPEKYSDEAAEARADKGGVDARNS